MCILTVPRLLQTLCSDVLGVINAMYGKDPPSIIFIGHRCVLVLLTAVSVVCVASSSVFPPNVASPLRS